jgi:hypothetical protein
VWRRRGECTTRDEAHETSVEPIALYERTYDKSNETTKKKSKIKLLVVLLGFSAISLSSSFTIFLIILARGRQSVFDG